MTDTSHTVPGPNPEPAAEVELPPLPARPRAIRPGLRVQIRGRTVRLRGIRRPPTGALRWLAILGPGLIAAASGNDGGFIASYSLAGAQVGYDILWVITLISIALCAIQEMAARLGAATGRGLLDLIREEYGIGWALFALGIALVTNVATVVSEFVAVVAAADLLGISRLILVAAAVALTSFLIVSGTYGTVEKVFVVMTLVFLAYPVAAVLSHPNWAQVAQGFVPRIHTDAAYLLLLVALFGTTATPYQQFYQQSSVVEKGVSRHQYGPERTDTYIGVTLAQVVGGFIVVAAAATLHATNKTDINTAADAARALEPAAGQAAYLLFSVGLLGASLIAAAILPLSSAYLVGEAFGLPKGVRLKVRQGRVFYGLYLGMLVLGGVAALVPNVPVIQLLIGIQVLNGILLPIVLLFILLLVNDRRLMGNLRNSRISNLVGWTAFAVITLSVVLLLGTQALGLMGIHVFG